MSAVMHLAPGVEITLLKRHFAVVTVAVGVVRMPEKGSKLPHTVMRDFVGAKWYLWVEDEMDGVCAFNPVSNALGKATKFIGQWS